MILRLIVTLALVALTLMSCSRRQEENTKPSTLAFATARQLNIQPVAVCIDTTGRQIGFGTWIKDPLKGEYLVTARHLFNQARTYYIGYSVDGKKLKFRPIIGVDNFQTEVCVCKIGLGGEIPPVLSTLQSKTSSDIEKLVRGGISINLTAKPSGLFTSIVTKNSTKSVAEWIGLPDKIQVLDCYLGPGSSGTGFTREGDDTTFWVILGGWPDVFLPQMKDLSEVENPKGFTTICGLGWSQIEEVRISLFGK